MIILVQVYNFGWKTNWNNIHCNQIYIETHYNSSFILGSLLDSLTHPLNHNNRWKKSKQKGNKKFVPYSNCFVSFYTSIFNGVSLSFLLKLTSEDNTLKTIVRERERKCLTALRSIFFFVSFIFGVFSCQKPCRSISNCKGWMWEVLSYDFHKKLYHF